MAEGSIKKSTMLRRLMDNGTVEAIGAQDAFSARLVELAGFDAVYLSGLTSTAALLARPDMAFMSQTERLQVARNMAQAVEIPVIADAEEGYGNAIHVMETVRRFEETGVAAIHIDDERLPGKCAFLPGIPKNQLISAEEMCGKIAAAVEARRDPDFMIIARTDVIGTVPKETFIAQNMIEDAIERSQSYLAAGADAIFMYCITREQLRRCAEAIKAPLVTLAAESERTYGETFSIGVFNDLGYKIVISPLGTLYTAAHGVVEGLRAYKETGNWENIPRINKETFDQIVRTQDYAPLYEKFHIS